MKEAFNALILTNVSKNLREFLANDKYEEKLKKAYKNEV